MTYQERLSPWTIIRLQPDQEQVTVGRFRRRSDAEGHLRILQQTMPTAEFAIAFTSLKAAIQEAVN
jgi:hypothetical protein